MGVLELHHAITYTYVSRVSVYSGKLFQSKTCHLVFARDLAAIGYSEVSARQELTVYTPIEICTWKVRFLYTSLQL